jgi:hypothetical protein
MLIVAMKAAVTMKAAMMIMNNKKKFLIKKVPKHLKLFLLF